MKSLKRGLMWALVASFVLCASSAAAPPGYWLNLRGQWNPWVEASQDKEQIKLGETVHVEYQCFNATACRRDVTHWARFIGKSDGVVMPLQGSYDVTPDKVGEFTTTITAYKRFFDLNHSGGADGTRRSFTKTLKINVSE